MQIFLHACYEFMNSHKKVPRDLHCLADIQVICNYMMMSFKTNLETDFHFTKLSTCNYFYERNCNICMTVIYHFVLCMTKQKYVGRTPNFTETGPLKVSDFPSHCQVRKTIGCFSTSYVPGSLNWMDITKTKNIYRVYENYNYYQTIRQLNVFPVSQFPFRL